jgi:NADH:ubiquinone oxidoreductase subunit 3 (subunit A)
MLYFGGSFHNVSLSTQSTAARSTWCAKRGNPSVNEWTFIAILAVISVITPMAPIMIGRLIGPSKPNREKNSTYECGVETVGDTWVQFKVQYYIFALVFLVFDIEVVFLFPWAVAYNHLTLFGVVAGVIFIVTLAEALVYAWRKGALEWL